MYSPVNPNYKIKWCVRVAAFHEHVSMMTKLISYLVVILRILQFEEHEKVKSALKMSHCGTII